MKIELVFFRESGTYYTEETLEIPNLYSWEYKEFIKHQYENVQNRLRGMTCHGHYENEEPFLCKID